MHILKKTNAVENISREIVITFQELIKNGEHDHKPTFNVYKRHTDGLRTVTILQHFFVPHSTLISDAKIKQSKDKGIE